MNGNRSYAWAVGVTRDDLVASAVLSGQALRNTISCGTSLVVVSNSISKSCISQLESAFDLVIVKDLETLTEKLTYLKGVNSEVDSLLVSALSMTTFSKLVVLQPGILVHKQSDKLFDSDNLLILDKTGSFKVAVVTPDKKKYVEIVQKVEGYENADILKLIFAGNRQSMDIHSNRISYWGNAGQRVNGNRNGIQEALSHSCGAELSRNDADTSDWIAIVGMACRFPNANSTQEYWDLLASGQNACMFPPDHRKKLIDLDPQVKANFLKCPIDQFDATFFGFSPSEATFTDPQARLLLEVSWEAFEDAAMNPDKLKGSSTGVFYGSWLQEYRDAMNTDGSAATEDFIRKYIGNSFGCSAAKLSFFYGFTGPNVSTESGCSSSMVAVDLAIKSLQKRECPVAMVAGANVLLHMNMKQKVLWAEDGKSKTFDSDANGYARAEGIAVLILKRFSDAKRDGNRIHAVIRGSAVSQEGLSKSFGTPTVESESTAMRDALRTAKVEPCEVDYVEAHATGTVVGDPIEAQAIVKAYSGKRDKPLYIGSGKTNVGHTESCSGMAGIFKVVLALKNELIPAHLNLNKLNPHVNFDSIPGRIPLQAVPWLKESGGKARIAGVSSFGITGTDVHVIIQEAPEELDTASKKKNTLTPPLHMLTISAKSEAALDEFTDLYKTFLESTSENVQDITYNANARRPHHPFRRAILGASTQDLRNHLAEGLYHHGRANTPKICFTFPGRIGPMNLEPARILYRTSPVFKGTMDDCDRLFQASTGKTMIPLLTNAQEDEILKGVTWYALIPTIQYSLVKLWASWGIVPDCVMGHCIGEISAAVVSGALPLDDVFKLVKCMDYFLQCGREQPALMMAIQTSVEKVGELISLFLDNNNQKTSTCWIDIASSNAFDQTVVAGDSESMEKFKTFVNTQGYRCKLLVMDFCAHSRAVEPACQKSLPVFQEITHQKMTIPYISSVTGKVVHDKDMNGQYWHNVFRKCVNFTDSCRTSCKDGFADVYIEMGLDGALSRLTQENLIALETSSSKKSVCLPSLWKVKGDKCWVGLLSSVAQLYTLGGNLDWDGFYGDHSGTVESHKKLTLPSYPFQRKSFWYERRNRRPEVDIENQQVFGINQPWKRIHPLLGYPVETCVEDSLIFQNWMGGQCLVEKYVYDHLIGTHVIFPGAAFLEMILAAVRNAEGGNQLVQVEGFVVNSPLHLEESIPKRIQCVVDKHSQTGRVYAAINGMALQWKLHATGGYNLTVEGDTFPDKIKEFEKIKRTCVQIHAAVEEFYSGAKQVGLNFGEDFRSMKKIFRTETETLIEVGIPREERDGDAVGYVCHPVLIDAMIQGFILHTKAEFKKLHVPVRIGKFLVRIQEPRDYSQMSWYVYCKTEPDSGLSKEVYLVDPEGAVIAVMTNAELVMTSVESILKAAGCFSRTENEKEDIPVENVTLDKFDIVWRRSKFHQSGNSISLQEVESEEIKLVMDNVREVLEKKNSFSEVENELDTKVSRLCHLYIVKALYEFGWNPSDGLADLTGNATEKWRVLPELVPAYNHFVSYLSKETILKTADSLTPLQKEIDQILDELQDYSALETVQACGSQLAGILRGTVNPHKILFGGNRDSVSASSNLAEHYYRTTRFAKVAESLEEIFKVIQGEIQRNKKTGSDTIRILEVGAGTGAFASGVLRFFREVMPGVKYEFTFTDISQGFLSKAKEKFAGECFQFKTFNIELDPLKQGFSPEYFDVVVAMDVVHATRNVKYSLSNLEMVTKPGGWMLLAETEKPVMEVDICFGILEGYWLYDDGIRKDHCTLDGDTWLELLKENGFTRGQGKFLSCESQMSAITAQKERRCTKQNAVTGLSNKWFVFNTTEATQNFITIMESFTKKMKAANREVSRIGLRDVRNLKDVIHECLHDNQETLEGIIFWIGGTGSPNDGPDSRAVLEPLLHLASCLLQKKGKMLPRFHVVTEGCQNTVTEAESGMHFSVNAAQAWGFMRNLRIELPGILSKSVDLEPGADVQEQCSQLMSELWLDDRETEVAFRGNVRHVRRTLHRDPMSNHDDDDDVGIQNCGKYFSVELPRSKVISDVKFVKMEPPRELAADEILVEVKSVSLNFKDVLAVMKPSSDFENLTSIGLDFSGMVISTGNRVSKWKVGQQVFGCGWEQGAMKSHIVTNQDAVVTVPDWMTFNEAATLPAVWITAWYCMVEIAKLQKGQTVLIHAASGGVGLIAIQIAKLLGAHVIGTAGTEKKRNFVRSLEVDQVYNSRSVEFGKRINEFTNGQGVDMVLNCLTGPGFKEASLDVCKDGGHFVEISKLDIWTPAQVKEKRAAVNYTIVDATQIDKLLLQDILNKLTDLLKVGSITPLSYTQYPATRVKDALTYLQKAKQIGKVIITMPQFEEEQGNLQRENLFNARSTYLITGGKGAIGLTVTKWMLTQGAKHVVLVGRSPATEKLKEAILEIKRDHDAVIVCKECDISNFEDCKNLLDELKNLPPLRGIHHCAGVLADKLLSHHDDWSGYEVVLSPKVNGAWNLHQLTRFQNLEHFVLYSSAASTFGNIGQSNYVAANCYLDCLAEMRVALGLPCLSINWGQWNMGFAKDLSVDWLHPFTAAEGVASLENLMTTKNPPCVVAGLFDFYGLLRMTPYFRDSFLEMMNLDNASFFGRDANNSESCSKQESGTTKKVLLIHQFQELHDETHRHQLVRDFVIRILCETLGTKPDDIQDDDQHFSEMGMDSLMSIEFANKLNSEVDGSSGGGGFIDLEESGTVSKMTELLNQTLIKMAP